MLFAICFTLSQARHADHTLVLSTLGASLKASHDPVSFPRATINRVCLPTGCDACRARKVRCARDNPDDTQSSCKHCITLGIPCTYDYQPKKRGPPNLYGIAASLTCSSFDPRPLRWPTTSPTGTCAGSRRLPQRLRPNSRWNAKWEKPLPPSLPARA